MGNMSHEEMMIWDEARTWAVAEVLAKHRDELRAFQIKHYNRLMANDYYAPYCTCEVFIPNPNEFVKKCVNCGGYPRP